MKTLIILSIIALIYIMLLKIYKKNKNKEISEIKDDNFKNYADVYSFLKNNYNFLEYNSEDMKRLVVLIYFGWRITDFSDLNKLTLERRFKIKHFIPKIKKIEMRY